MRGISLFFIFIFCSFTNFISSSLDEDSVAVFEGTVINQYCYFTKFREVKTCSTIRVDKVFKGLGKINLGTVNVITAQSGCVGDVCIEVFDGPPGIGFPMTGLFFVRDADSRLVNSEMPKTSNTVFFQLNKIAIYDYVNSTKLPNHIPFVFFDNRSFGSARDFYAYLKSNYGLSVQAQASVILDNPKLQINPGTVKVVR